MQAHLGLLRADRELLKALLELLGRGLGGQETQAPRELGKVHCVLDNVVLEHGERKGRVKHRDKEGVPDWRKWAIARGVSGGVQRTVVEEGCSASLGETSPRRHCFDERPLLGWREIRTTVLLLSCIEMSLGSGPKRGAMRLSVSHGEC